MESKSGYKFQSNDKIIEFMNKILNKVIQSDFGEGFYLKLDSFTYNELLKNNLFKVQRAYISIGHSMTQKERYRLRDFVNKKYNLMLASMCFDTDNLVRKIELIFH